MCLTEDHTVWMRTNDTPFVQIYSESYFILFHFILLFSSCVGSFPLVVMFSCGYLFTITSTSAQYQNDMVCCVFHQFLLLWFPLPNVCRLFGFRCKLLLVLALTSLSSYSIPIVSVCSRFSPILSCKTTWHLVPDKNHSIHTHEMPERLRSTLSEIPNKWAGNALVLRIHVNLAACIYSLSEFRILIAWIHKAEGMPEPLEKRFNCSQLILNVERIEALC